MKAGTAILIGIVVCGVLAYGLFGTGASIESVRLAFQHSWQLRSTTRRASFASASLGDARWPGRPPPRSQSAATAADTRLRRTRVYTDSPGSHGGGDAAGPASRADATG